MKRLLLAKPVDAMVFHKWMGVEYAESEFLVMSADAAEYAIKSGARSIRYVDGIWSSQSSSHYEADRLARIFDRECSVLREKYFELNGGMGWEYRNAYYIAYTIKRAHVVSDLLSEHEFKAGSYAVTCDSDQDYYFDSAWQRASILKGVNNISLVNYNGGISALDIGQSFALEIPDVGAVNRLIHLPTIFCNMEEYKDRLLPFESRSLDIQSPYFDVPFLKRRIELIQTNGVKVLEALPGQFVSEYASLARWFAHCLGMDGNFEARLVSRFLKRMASQLLVYHQLLGSEILNEVSVIELADQDTGLQGPIISFAKKRCIDTYIFPHSGSTVAPMSADKNMHKLSCLSADSETTTLGVEFLAHCNILSFPEHKKEIMKRVVVLLNEMDDVAGFMSLPVWEIEGALAGFVSNLSEQGWDVKLRHKPNHRYIHLIGQLEDDAGGDLDKWVTWPSYCIGVGEVTTALMKFRMNGVRCFHVSPAALTDRDKQSLPGDTVVVAGEGLKLGFEKILHLLERSQNER